MNLTDEEARRARTILCEQWVLAVEQRTGGVPSRAIYEQLDSEGIYPGVGDMDRLLEQIEHDGHINTGEALDDDAALTGGLWIDYVSDDFLQRYG